MSNSNNLSKSQKLKNLLKNPNHVISILLIIALLAIAIFCFPASIIRFLEALRDFILSFANYFIVLFGGDGIHVPVNEPSTVSLIDLGILPENFDLFLIKLKLWAQSLIHLNTLGAYGVVLADVLYNIAYGLLVALPFILLFIFIGWLEFKKTSDIEEDTKPLKILKNFSKLYYTPIKKWLQQFIKFAKEHKAYYIIWLCEWLFIFNVGAIAVDFIAYYLYVVSTFELSTLYMQFYKLLVDLAVPITTIPALIWAVIGLIAYDIWRNHHAMNKLSDIIDDGEETAQNMPIASLITGAMGTYKTTLATFLTLLWNMIHRKVALKKLIQNDLKFPNFPWIRLERYIKKGMENHTIYNLATAGEIARRLRWIHERKFPNAADAAFNALKKHCFYEYDDLFFGYDVEQYGFYYFDQLEEKTLFDVMEIYAQLYFIYVIKCSLILSSYSIRVDDYQDDIGNFPLWDMDFFRSDIELIKEKTQRSHIIDYDALRLGKRVIQDNRFKDAIDFGIITITEIGKERGNQKTTSGTSRKDATANQLNDLFTIDVKMCRHRATVDNYPFVVFIMDEQRAASLNADTMELCDIIYIIDNTEFKLCTPLFALDELIYTCATKVFNWYYKKERHNKAGDNLFRHIIKSLYNVIYSHYTKIYNRYSVSTLTFNVQRGAMKGEGKSRKIKMPKWAIHSGRFATDAFAGFYRRKTKRSNYGITDLVQYEGKTATFDELDMQHSFFVRDIKPVFNGDINFTNLKGAEGDDKKQ